MSRSTGILRLPIYPSARARKSLSPSQLATLQQLISTSLAQCLSLPIYQCDATSTAAFLASYSQDAAGKVLEDIIWASEKEDGSGMSAAERTIRHRALQLAERMAPFMSFQTLLDFSIAFEKRHSKTIKKLFASAFLQNDTSLASQVSNDAIPALTTLLRSLDQGLYGVRKVSYILLACLRAAPAEVKRAFARDKSFMLALASAYDEGLSNLAQSYGGFRALNDTSQEVDDWERIFLETKVALMDTFHILIRTLFDNVASVPSSGPDLTAQCEPAFEVIFSLLGLPQSHPQISGGSTATITATPFLNQSLLVDYQHAYDLSRTVASVLCKADDARSQLLESSLRSLESSSSANNPGALKLLLRSSGITPGIDHRGNRSQSSSKWEGKAAALAMAKPDPALDAAVSQVLDILPDHPPHYLRYLLGHSDYPYKGSAERLIEALFEGTAPNLEDVEASMRATEGTDPVAEIQQDEFQFTKDRRNVFDDVAMDMSQLRIGKKGEGDTILQDRSFIEQMKADILRRVEEAANEDEDDMENDEDKGKGRDLAFEDEIDEDPGVKVRDGEVSGDEESDDDRAEGDTHPATPAKPETILELAYIRDPKLFDRDAQTRRSKARDELRIQTGWKDEQIEGWRIMLERNPNKEKILQKHEFSGNKPISNLDLPTEGPSRSQSREGGRGRGRGGRGGRGGARGRGRGGNSGGGGDGGNARDRAWKDRNKSSKANHNRKAGHDKKMARGGGPA